MWAWRDGAQKLSVHAQTQNVIEAAVAQAEDSLRQAQFDLLVADTARALISGEIGAHGAFYRWERRGAAAGNRADLPALGVRTPPYIPLR
jgi:hypothetical protein